MRIVIHTVVTASLLTVLGFGQETHRRPFKREVYDFATLRLSSKGGVGNISADLFIVVTSDKNELVLKDGRTWTGQAAEKREFVVVFQNRVLSPANIPKDFDLSKAVAVSFEGKIIRYFAFDNMEGGYYERFKPD